MSLAIFPDTLISNLFKISEFFKNLIYNLLVTGSAIGKANKVNYTAVFPSTLELNFKNDIEAWAFAVTLTSKLT